MIVRKYDDYFLIKVFNENIGDLNIFDIDSIENFFQFIFDKLKKNYKLNGLIAVDVYVNNLYGIIIELKPIDSYFDEINISIKMHLDGEFLVCIDANEILNYDDVYYYKGKFYGIYSGLCDNEIIYKDVEEIIDRGIKIC